MTPIQTKVLEALRSGNYTKRQGRMRVGCTYCAQGVIADVLLKEGLIKGEWVQDSESSHLFWAGFVPMSLVLKDKTAWTYGMAQVFHQWPELGINDALADSIIVHNDRGDSSFVEIADWLESVWSMP